MNSNVNRECIEDTKTLDIVIQENGECLVTGERTKELLVEVVGEIQKHLDMENYKLRGDEEEEAKRSGVSFNKHDGLLRVWNVAGVVLYRGLKLWIVPKILGFKNQDPSKLKSNTISLLYHMVNYVKGHWMISRITARKGDPLTFLSEIYLKLLDYELKRGFYREYVQLVDESSFVKGKILIREYLRRYPAKVHAPVSMYWKLSLDVPLNRILYSATQKALTYNPGSRSVALRILSMLEEAEEIDEWIGVDISAVRFNRLNERFREAFNMACLILGYTGVVGKEALVFAYNTPKLFEEYVYRILLREIGNVEYQKKLKLIVDGKEKYVVPDIVLGSKEEIPLDVKYKILETEPIYSDLYQVSFYARLLNSRRAILAYPAIGNGGDIKVDASSITGQNTLTIHILRYDFSSVLEHGDLDKNFIISMKEVLK